MTNSPSMTDRPRDLHSPEQISARPEIQSDAELEILPPQDGSDQNSTAGSQSSNVSDVMQVQGNTTVDQNLSVMDTILVRVKKAGREVKHDGCGLFNETSWRWRVAVTFLALWGIVVPTYLTLRYNGPANSFAQQSLKAAEWANYYEWLWTVCPAEQARNMSTPECEQAQMVTVPPLQRPYSNIKRQFIEDISQGLSGLENATQLLQIDADTVMEHSWVLRADADAAIDHSWMEPPVGYESKQLWIFHFSSRPVQDVRGEWVRGQWINETMDRQAWEIAQTESAALFLKLASTESRRSYLIAWFLCKLGLYILICSVFISTSCPTFNCLRISLWARSTRSATRKSVTLQLLWIGSLTWSTALVLVMLVLNVKELATWFMKDRLLDFCLTYRNVFEFPECHPVQELVTGISHFEEISVISAWRTYISTNIEYYDFTLIELDPLFVASLLSLVLIKFEGVIRLYLKRIWHLRPWKLSRRIVTIDHKQQDRSSHIFDEKNVIQEDWGDIHIV